MLIGVQPPIVSWLGGDLLGPMVDIYLSAGPDRGHGPTTSAAGTPWNPNDYFSCNRDEVRNCEIWRVRLRLGMSAPTDIERVVATTSRHRAPAGASMPALSPDGRYLTLRRQTYSDVNADTLRTDIWSAITVFDLRDRTEWLVDEGDDVADSLRFPTWQDGQRLLYNRSTPLVPKKAPSPTNNGSLFAADVDVRTGNVSLQGPVLGPYSGHYTDTGFNNPAVHPQRSRPGPDPLTSPRLATFGESFGARGSGNTTGCTSSLQGIPHVHGLPRLGGAGGTTFECFELGENRNGDSVSSCQHPHWSLDSQSVYCWHENPGDGFLPTGEPSTSRLQLLYQYHQERPGQAWVQVGTRTAFPELSPEELANEFPGVFPTVGSLLPLGGPRCVTAAYKHGIECGSSNFIVLTLFCSDPTYNGYSTKSDVFSSRVMLVRRAPLKYWDITAMIEDFNGARRGAWHGIYATCSSPAE